jgi:hypothetical protein
MSDDPETTDFGELIERSSLGTPEARRYRRETPATVRHQILAGLARREPRTDDGPVPENSDPTTSYFYLSHERDSATGLAGPAVEELFHLLCAYLRELDADFDRDGRSATVPVIPGRLAGVPVGGGLLREIVVPLAGCRVFVPLLSAKYFANEWSRHELEMVKRRDDMARRDVPFGLSAIVPVLWDAATDIALPPWATDLPWRDERLGGDYLELGLRGLRDQDREHYHRVAFHIARRIRDLAATLPPLPGPESGDEN